MGVDSGQVNAGILSDRTSSVHDYIETALKEKDAK